jgi:dipeptidyl aminopeptidase/acylaminoacyl peptidase
MHLPRLAAAALFVLSNCPTAPAAERPTTAPASTQPFRFDPREQRFTSPVDKSPQTYLVQEWGEREPTGEGPLVVLYLHGSGSHQDQGMRSGIYGDVFGRMGRWLSKRRAVYICPEYRGDSWMGPAAERDLMELLRLAGERHRPSAVLLTGGSMGGTSALVFASLHPDLVDGVLAWCPATDAAAMYPRFPDQFRAAYGGTPDEVPAEYRRRSSREGANALATMPVVLVHGSADTVIPVEHSRTLVERLRARQAKVQYVELKGGDHDAPLSADVVKPLEWLIAKARGEPRQVHPLR